MTQADTNDGPRSDASSKTPSGNVVLAAVLVVATSIVITIAYLTTDRIGANERAWFVARLQALIPQDLHDNDLYADSISVAAPDLLGTDDAITIFRARLQNAPTAAVLTAVAPDGYGGAIDLLIGVDYEGNLLGVDVLKHNETQGIGDGFLPHRSKWLTHLVGRSLLNPPATRWTIRKDGGEFDQFTGASITPRAILKAIRRTLEYYAAHRARIFDAPNDTH